ncbi:hydroxyacid dehydrogenase [Aquifex pyrophilus]
MKIVFTSVDPNFVDFFRENLKGFDVKVYTQTIDEVPLDEIKDADILSVFVFDRLTREVLEKFESLKLVHTRSVGFDHIDLEFCRERGIKVTHIPAYSPSAVAQHTFSLILYLVRKLGKIREMVDKLNFSQDYGIASENLEDLTLGVIGTGRIGSIVARYGLSFGMRVLAYDIYENEELKKAGVLYTSLENLLRDSDIISLHVPYTPKTHHLINEERIKLMKEGVILINTARGKVLDTDALYKNYEKFGGIGLDVFEDEEILILKRYKKGLSSDKNLKILELSRKENVVITPHIAYFTKRAVRNINNQTVEVIKAFAEGREDILSRYEVKLY